MGIKDLTGCGIADTKGQRVLLHGVYLAFKHI